MATTLFVVFIGFGFSSCVPVLLLFVSIILLTTYFYERRALLKYNSRDVAIDSAMNERVISLLPLAFFMHSFVALFAYLLFYLS
jgi:hypothetical protein